MSMYGKSKYQEARYIAKSYNHLIKKNQNGDYVITGPWFPTGYFTDDLSDAVDTLMYEVRRHQVKKNPRESKPATRPISYCECGKRGNIIMVEKDGSKHAYCKKCINDYKAWAKGYRVPVSNPSQSVARTKYADKARLRREYDKAMQKGDRYTAQIIAKKLVANPRGVVIYSDVVRIIARKGQKHICDAECRRKDHTYYHDFTPGSKIVGLPNKKLLIG